MTSFHFMSEICSEDLNFFVFFVSSLICKTCAKYTKTKHYCSCASEYRGKPEGVHQPRLAWSCAHPLLGRLCWTISVCRFKKFNSYKESSDQPVCRSFGEWAESEMSTEPDFHWKFLFSYAIAAKSHRN